jgi:hypothetical protein
MNIREILESQVEEIVEKITNAFDIYNKVSLIWDGEKFDVVGGVCPDAIEVFERFFFESTTENEYYTLENMLREKGVNIDEVEYDDVEDLAKKFGIEYSEVLREAMKSEIEEEIYVKYHRICRES